MRVCIRDQTSQLHVVRHACRARGRCLRRLASTLQGGRDELRRALGLRQAGSRDVLPDDGRRHDEVPDQAKLARLSGAASSVGKLLVEHL